MMRQTIYPVLFLTLALAGLTFAEEPAPQVLRAGCSAEEEQVAVIGAADQVEVKQALAGGAETCYKVSVLRDGQTLNGYLLGDASPQVAAFVAHQGEYRDASFLAREQAERERVRQEALAKEKAAREAAAAATLAAKANLPPAPKMDPNMPPSFEDFSGRDLQGKRVSLSGLGGRVTIVTFWSPRSGIARGKLLGLMPLYTQYKKAGLRAVGIGMDSSAERLADSLDDVSLGYPQIPDRTGLAKRYLANSAKGTVLVLDANHNIVAADPSPAELEAKVRELLR